MYGLISVPLSVLQISSSEDTLQVPWSVGLHLSAARGTMQAQLLPSNTPFAFARMSSLPDTSLYINPIAPSCASMGRATQNTYMPQGLMNMDIFGTEHLGIAPQHKPGICVNTREEMPGKRGKEQKKGASKRQKGELRGNGAASGTRTKNGWNGLRETPPPEDRGDVGL